MWVTCDECIYYQDGDCEKIENNDGCYFGFSVNDLEDN